MRVKQLWDYLPLPSKLKLIWDRLTLSRITTFYFIFSLLHCIIQVALQIRAFHVNAEAATFLLSVAEKVGALDGRIPAISSSDLRLCPDVPRDPFNLSACPVVWDGQPQENSVGESAPSYGVEEPASSPQESDTSSPTESATSASPIVTSSSSSVPPTTTILRTAAAPVISVPSTRTVFVITTPTPSAVNNAGNVAIAVGGAVSGASDDDDDDDDELDDFDKRARQVLSASSNSNGSVEVIINGPGFNGTPALLSKSCLWSLNWPVEILTNTKREDIVFIAFQFWVLGMSIVALLNESIPHVFASLFTHILATAWSAFQVNHTANFRKQFTWAITKGACNGVALLPHFWEERAIAEYATLALNIVSLGLSAFFTWKLVKLFGWQTFKRVGASRTINRVYKFVLSLSICLQLGFFFVTAMVGIWLDSLFNGVAAQVAWYVALYKASSFITLALLLPWLISGWYAVRKEKRILMFVFLVLSLLYLGGWSVMFASDTFRWLFIQWRFFSFMSAASVFLTLTAFILGVICRYNFGKGLPRYLNAQEPLEGEDFAPVIGGDPERVAFPSNEKPMPTFSVAFGSGDEVPPPAQMFAQGRLGPRFFDQSAPPFESSPDAIPIPDSAFVRPPPYDIERPVHRSDSQNSGRSYGSMASYYSYSSPSSHSRTESNDVRGKRWLIE